MIKIRNTMVGRTQSISTIDGTILNNHKTTLEMNTIFSTQTVGFWREF